MVEYSCERCGHTFPKLWKFRNHQNRKFKCKPLSSTSQAQSTADIQTGQEANQAPIQLDNQEPERGEEEDSDYETADEGEEPEVSRAGPSMQAHRPEEKENKTEGGGLFSTITGAIRRWFGNLLSLTPKVPSWGNPTPTELTELEENSDGYDTADEGDDLNSFNFVKKGHDPTRPHSSLKQMAVWKSDIPSKYGGLGYFPELIGY